MTRLQPLGIDIGSTRVRVALSECGGESRLRLRAVVSRELPQESWRDGGTELDLAAAILEELLRELGVRIKECITAVGAPYAALRVVRFPKMSRIERLRAARFELLQESWSENRSIVRVHPVDRRAELFAVAVIDDVVLKRHVEVLRKAGLRVVAIDHDACALARILPNFDAIADIGRDGMRLHVFRDASLTSWTAALGGGSVTQAIATALSIDEESAEHRKRILGVAGAGQSALTELAQALGKLLGQAQAAGARVSRLALIGNGARLPGFAELVEESAGVYIERPVAALLQTAEIDDEVLRVAAPDWTLAAALSGWAAA
ncbi:MAG TPA: pilus assembly protein PilM [Candidatus Tyrphobacter sp.]